MTTEEGMYMTYASLIDVAVHCENLFTKQQRGPKILKFKSDLSDQKSLKKLKSGEHYNHVFCAALHGADSLSLQMF